MFHVKRGNPVDNSVDKIICHLICSESNLFKKTIYWLI